MFKVFNEPIGSKNRFVIKESIDFFIFTYWRRTNITGNCYSKLHKLSSRMNLNKEKQ